MFTPDEEFTLIYHRDEEFRHWKKNAGLQVSNGAVAKYTKDGVLKGKTKIVLNVLSINVYFGYNSEFL